MQPAALQGAEPQTHHWAPEIECFLYKQNYLYDSSPLHLCTRSSIAFLKSCLFSLVCVIKLSVLLSPLTMAAAICPLSLGILPLTGVEMELCTNSCIHHVTPSARSICPTWPAITSCSTASSWDSSVSLSASLLLVAELFLKAHKSLSEVVLLLCIHGVKIQIQRYKSKVE